MQEGHRLKLIVPPHEVRWFPEGEHCTDAEPGDLFIVRHNTVFADAIAAGQRVLAHTTEPELRGFTWGDHVAFSRPANNGIPTLSEMGPKGYERRPVYDYVAHLYAVVHFDVTDEQRKQAMAYDDACSGVTYGWAEYLPIIIDGLTSAEFAGSWGDAIICSTHLSIVLAGLGFFVDRPATAVIPAHFSYWTGAAHD